MGSTSIWHWLIVLLIVALVFGTKKLRGAGKDLGEAVRGFKEGVGGEAAKPAEPAELGEPESLGQREAKPPVDRKEAP